MGGNQGNVTYSYSDSAPGDGSVEMSAFGTITYTGLEPVTNDGTADNVVFNLPATDNVVFLEDNGDVDDGMLRLRSMVYSSILIAVMSHTDLIAPMACRESGSITGT